MGGYCGIDNVISSLDGALSRSIVDILGAGLFSSLAKRDKIKNANDDVREL